MRTGSIFYQLLQSFPALLFELLGLDPGLAAQYRFVSQEIKKTAFRLDGIFLPSQRETPLHFVEVQFQPDPALYFRLLAEIPLFLRQHELEYS